VATSLHRRRLCGPPACSTPGPSRLRELTQHVRWVHKLRVVVRNALQTRDVTDGTDGGSADLTNTLGDVIRHGEELIAVVIEQMVVAKMWSAHMPMKVLRLDISGKYICKQGIECSRISLTALGSRSLATVRGLFAKQQDRWWLT
jgi:hypothetical protein